jgi:hypothetical protein
MVEYVGIVVQDIVNLVDFAVRSIQADLTTNKHISLGPACRQKFLNSLYIELPELLEIEPPAWSSDCKLLGILRLNGSLRDGNCWIIGYQGSDPLMVRLKEITVKRQDSTCWEGFVVRLSQILIEFENRFHPKANLLS